MEYIYILTSFNLATLNGQLAATSVASLCQGSCAKGTEITLLFSQELTLDEKSIVDNVVAAHPGSLSTSFEYKFEASKVTQDASITFARTLLHDWMRYNTLQGMSIVQSVWVFSRFEDMNIAFPFGTKRIDLFKMFYSGALPTVYYCLLRVQPDDMSQTYHWVSQDRIDWVKSRVRAQIGNSMATYIEGLA